MYWFLLRGMNIFIYDFIFRDMGDMGCDIGDMGGDMGDMGGDMGDMGGDIGYLYNVLIIVSCYEYFYISHYI